LIHVINPRERANTDTVHLQPVHLGTLDFYWHAQQQDSRSQGLGIFKDAKRANLQEIRPAGCGRRL
jgi:phenylpropionate dioxygenase-like ring-hydroxylating dioxygenase large terminal subunit